MIDLLGRRRFLRCEIWPHVDIDLQASARPRRAIGLRRLHAEEAVAIPACAGHRLRDLRQAAIRLAVPGEPPFQDHHPFQPALPLAN
jgi:hypothetical protein